jgi:hypothetical protein
MRISSLIILFVCCLPSGAFADDKDWYETAVTSDGKDTYSIKLGSGKFGTNKNGEPITTVIGRTVNKDDHQVHLYKWYVTDADCTNEYGKLVVLDLDGSYKFEAPYVKDSDSIGSEIAEAICAAAKSQRTKDEGKGL